MATDPSAPMSHSAFNLQDSKLAVICLGNVGFDIVQRHIGNLAVASASPDHLKQKKTSLTLASYEAFSAIIIVIIFKDIPPMSNSAFNLQDSKLAIIDLGYVGFDIAQRQKDGKTYDV